MNGYIYLISGVHGQGCYVGQSTNLTTRWRKHRWDLEAARHVNPYLQNAWGKHGSDAYGWVVLEEVVAGELGDREIYWHDRLKSEGVTLYNIATPGNASRLGCSPSEETRQKISQALTGKHLTAAHKQRLAEVNTGKVMSEETKHKISKALIGKNKGRKIGKMPEEQRQRMIGRKQSAETIKKRVESMRRNKDQISLVLQGQGFIQEEVA